MVNLLVVVGVSIMYCLLIFSIALFLKLIEFQIKNFFTRSYLIFLISLYWDSGTITSGKSLEDDLKQTPMVRTYDTKFPNPSVLKSFLYCFHNSGSFGKRWNLIGLPLESFTKTQAGTAVTFHCGL
uniref:Uncharacterized protein n=1 Tax=Clytia hemisphaerica TaxID=252671 RepID=A0A7M5XJQ0_9CNID